MPKPNLLIHDILKAYDEEKQKSASNEAKLYFSKLSYVTQFCRECGKETEIILDSKQGDRVCDNCGLVLGEREIIETPFGRGSGGYGTGTADSDKLDLLTGEKHKEHGRTRRFYKTWLKRKVNEEIDGLVGHDDQLSELAKAMFEKYSDTLEQVRNREQVIEACIASAELRIKQREKIGEIKPLVFRCKKCKEAYSSKMDLRHHDCRPKDTK